ncbi:unnamed protein product [Rhizoctonia solani]|uniref:Uncharacterized protein n=1 Tax=Rhizoctonia solani TaxID=456999 RepID=A0A8H3BF08_9AGAM|nr:unnamed protein product [Rhizoctonia solani]
MASHSNLRGFFGSQNGAKPVKKKTQILISDDEDDEPPAKSPSKPKFGIVQTACREVLKQLFPSEPDEAVETPSTPKMSKSLESRSESPAKYDSRKSSQGRSVSTPFAHNPFTTVPPNYRENGSPQLQNSLNGKRNRGSGHNTPDLPDPKRIRPLPLTDQSSPTRKR